MILRRSDFPLSLEMKKDTVFKINSKFYQPIYINDTTCSVSNKEEKSYLQIFNSFEKDLVHLKPNHTVVQNVCYQDTKWNLQPAIRLKFKFIYTLVNFVFLLFFFFNAMRHCNSNLPVKQELD